VLLGIVNRIANVVNEAFYETVALNPALMTFTWYMDDGMNIVV
jgi:hypothetical protein